MRNSEFCREGGRVGRDCLLLSLRMTRRRDLRRMRRRGRRYFLRVSLVWYRNCIGWCCDVRSSWGEKFVGNVHLHVRIPREIIIVQRRNWGWWRCQGGIAESIPGTGSFDYHL